MNSLRASDQRSNTSGEELRENAIEGQQKERPGRKSLTF